MTYQPRASLRGLVVGVTLLFLSSGCVGWSSSDGDSLAGPSPSASPDTAEAARDACDEFDRGDMWHLESGYAEDGTYLAEEMWAAPGQDQSLDRLREHVTVARTDERFSELAVAADDLGSFGDRSEISERQARMSDACFALWESLADKS